MLEALVVIAASLVAQAPDAETRFHEAYLAEVVDGKVADAAREYVALMEDAAAAAAIRRESRFRFAVCCVLLGRADEARARLAEILADPETPEAMRARAEEYRRSVGEIGVGREIDKRLTELVFELGRTDYASHNPPLYRDFQIMGEAALPFLRKLLVHPDLLLRMHAIRILCRMGEPGLADRLDLSRKLDAYLANDLRSYLAEREDERARLRERLLGLDDELLLEQLSWLFQVNVAFPSSFARDIASREGCAEAALGILRRAGFGNAEWTLLVGWIREGGETLARESAKQLTSLCWDHDFAAHATPELFPVVVERLLGDEVLRTWRPHGQSRNLLPGAGSWGRTPHSRPGFEKYARTVPRETRLEVLEELVRIGTEWTADSRENPLWNGLADAVANTLDEEAGPADVQDYAKLIRRWAATPTHPDWIHFTVLFRKLDEDAAAEIAIWLFTEGPANTDATVGEWAKTLHVKDARDARLLLRVLPAVSEDVRAWLLPYQVGAMERDSEVAAVVVPAFPDLAAMAESKNAWERMVRQFQELAPLVSTETAVSALVDLLPVVGGRAWASHEDLVRQLLMVYGRESNRQEYWTRVAIPALGPVYEALDGRARQRVLDGALYFLSEEQSGLARLGEARAPLGAFVLEHVEEIGSNTVPLLRAPDLFPLEQWVHRIEGRSAWAGPARSAPDREAANAAARALAADPEKLTDSALSFIRQCTDEEVQREILDGLLAGEDLAKLEKAVQLVDAGSGYPATPQALEVALDRLLAREDSSLAVLVRLGRVLATVKPTEKLFPLARRLLASGKRSWILEGLSLTTRLGAADLLPGMVPLLESLDEEVRTATKQSMDAILELRRVKQEARERILEEGLREE